MGQYDRTISLIGEEGLERLKHSHVAVFGVGGVGGYVVEALARAGVGKLTLVDNDTVNETNLNRQIIALYSTIGKLKTEVCKERVKDIDPSIEVDTKAVFFLPENADTFDFSALDYVVDAIDTVSGKLALVEKAQAAGVKIISSMGAGNKLDPTAFKVADIYKTNVCPLAKAMRKECKARGLKGFKCVYSEEEPVVKERVIASISFVPSAVGLIIAGEVIKDLISIR